ncbi:hypothetical protein LCGC14_0076920 [marine sediment metagenome]|uniref:2-dehydropantoate 2-reductase n=2 Tax=root TaxID=1 RepID=A0A0F9VJY7_9ZZZZ
MTLTDKPIPQPLHWHVLGAGAMGCLWACAMAMQARDGASGRAQVSLLLRHQAALLSYPGHIKSSAMAQPVVMPAHTTGGNVVDLPGQIDNLFVATKAQDTLPALTGVAKYLTTDCRIVLLQNGLKVQREVSQQFGAERVFCLSTSHGAWLRAPFDVVHAGNGETWLGQLTPASDDSAARQQALLAVLPAQQLNIRIDDDIAARLWRKLAINCAINALTVIHDCRNGELLRIPAARQTLTRLCHEISALLQAIPAAPAIDDLFTQVQQVLMVTTDNISSTLQDVRRARDTEIDHLNGYLCELAAQHGLACPVNKAVLQQMRVLESRAKQAAQHTINQRPLT